MTELGGLDADFADFAKASRVKRKIRTERQRRRMRTRAARPLLDWVPALSPKFESPKHLGPVVDQLELVRAAIVKARDEGTKGFLRVLLSVPPGHWKSLTLHAFVALILVEDPSLRIGYGTYDKTFADENVASIRHLCGRARVAIGKVDKAGVFTTRARGRVLGFSLQKPPTGRRFDIIIVDDPYASRAEAESSVIRAKVSRGFHSDLMTRQVAGGSTVIVLHTRWHPEDLIGELAAAGWLYINLPAEDAKGNPLLPQMWTRAMLDERKKASEYDWWSLFMGKPRPPGGTIFLDAPQLVESFESDGAWFYVCGIDIARGEKQKNDANAYALTRRPVAERTRTRTPTIDIVDWLEEPGPLADIEQEDERTGKRVKRPGFVRHLVRIRTLYPGVVFCAYVGRTETNMLDLIEAASADKERRVAGVKIRPLEAQGVKLWHRAEAGYAPAWNARRVRVPRRDPKTGLLITRHKEFVGGAGIDHLISAVTSAYDWHVGKGPAAGRPQTTNEGSEADRMARYV